MKLYLIAGTELQINSEIWNLSESVRDYFPQEFIFILVISSALILAGMLGSLSLPNGFSIGLNKYRSFSLIGIGALIFVINIAFLTHIPLELYNKAASLNSINTVDTNKRRNSFYGSASRWASVKAILYESMSRKNEADFMSYIEAKSYYQLGLFNFNEERYLKAFSKFQLTVSRYRENNEFISLKDDGEMKRYFDEANRLDEELDQEEIDHALYLMALSKYRQWLINLGSRKQREENLEESIDLYKQVLLSSSSNKYYSRGSVWFDLGKAYQNNGDIDKARKALLAAHYSGNGDASTTLKELGVMNEDGVLIAIPDEESKQALLKVDGLSVYNNEDSQIAVGDDLPESDLDFLNKHYSEMQSNEDSQIAVGGDLSESGLDFLNKHYSEMQSVIKVDDMNTLTSLYNLRYHSGFQEDVNFVAFSRFWINEVAEIVDFEILSLDNVEEKFKISICLLRNGRQETLISIFPLVRGDSSWLIGKAYESSFQDGCSR